MRDAYELDRVGFRQRLVEDAFLEGRCSEKNLREHLKKLGKSLVDSDARVVELKRIAP